MSNEELIEIARLLYSRGLRADSPNINEYLSGDGYGGINLSQEEVSAINNLIDTKGANLSFQGDATQYKLAPYWENYLQSLTPTLTLNNVPFAFQQGDGSMLYSTQKVEPTQPIEDAQQVADTQPAQAKAEEKPIIDPLDERREKAILAGVNKLVDAERPNPLKDQGIESINQRLEAQQKKQQEAAKDAYDAAQAAEDARQKNRQNFVDIMKMYGTSNDPMSRFTSAGAQFGMMKKSQGESTGMKVLHGVAGAANILSGLFGLGQGLLAGMGYVNMNNELIKSAEERKREAENRANLWLAKEGGLYLGLGNGMFGPSSNTGEYIYALPKSMEDMANIEIEGGEYVNTPQGDVFEAKGAKHSQGGMPIDAEPETKILSDSMKIDRDFAREIRKAYNFAATPGNSYSTVMDKYKRHIGLKDLYYKMEQLYRKLDKNEDIQDLNTQRLNMTVINKGMFNTQQQIDALMPQMEEFFDFLYDEQERQKYDMYDRQLFGKGGKIRIHKFNEICRNYGYTPEFGRQLFIQEYKKRKPIETVSFRDIFNNYRRSKGYEPMVWAMKDGGLVKAADGLQTGNGNMTVDDIIKILSESLPQGKRLDDEQVQRFITEMASRPSMSLQDAIDTARKTFTEKDSDGNQRTIVGLENGITGLRQFAQEIPNVKDAKDIPIRYEDEFSGQDEKEEEKPVTTATTVSTTDTTTPQKQFEVDESKLKKKPINYGLVTPGFINPLPNPPMFNTLQQLRPSHYQAVTVNPSSQLVELNRNFKQQLDSMESVADSSKMAMMSALNATAEAGVAKVYERVNQYNINARTQAMNANTQIDNAYDRLNASLRKQYEDEIMQTLTNQETAEHRYINRLNDIKAQTINTINTEKVLRSLYPEMYIGPDGSITYVAEGDTLQKQNATALQLQAYGQNQMQKADELYGTKKSSTKK